jgi:hypothetical protein
MDLHGRPTLPDRDNLTNSHRTLLYLIR